MISLGTFLLFVLRHRARTAADTAAGLRESYVPRMRDAVDSKRHGLLLKWVDLPSFAVNVLVWSPSRYSTLSNTIALSGRACLQAQYEAARPVVMQA